MIPIQVVFSLPLFALHKLDSLDLHWFSFVSAFGDSNDDDINLDDLLPDIPNQGPASLDHPASPPQPPPILGRCPAVFERRIRGFGSKETTGTALHASATTIWQRWKDISKLSSLCKLSILCKICFIINLRRVYIFSVC
jgi:hypothetical protein